MFYEYFHLAVRWLHVIAGITWIGFLYFFNFVNVPFQGSIDDATKKAANPQLQPRVLWWFRWGAMTTFLAGLVLFVMNYMYTPELGFGPTPFWSGPEGLTSRAVWISMGMLFGFIMWFNVWMIIWPAQKKILGIVKAPPETLPSVRKRALLASRTNTFLSGPMLFGMLGANHYEGGSTGVALVISIALGVIAILWAIKTSYKVGKIA
jgi:uncharacterized membrane protein